MINKKILIVQAMGMYDFLYLQIIPIKKIKIGENDLNGKDVSMV